MIITIHNNRYDLTDFVDRHPGGNIFKNGKDMTKLFFDMNHGNYHLSILDKYKIDEKTPTNDSARSIYKRLQLYKCSHFLELHHYAYFSILFLLWNGFPIHKIWKSFLLSQIIFIVHNVTHHRHLSHYAFQFKSSLIGNFSVFLGAFASLKSGVFYAIHHRKHHMVCDDPEEEDPYGGYYSGWRYSLMMFPSDDRLQVLDFNTHPDLNTQFHRWHDKVAKYQGILWLNLVLLCSGPENYLENIGVYFCLPILFNIGCFWAQTIPHLLPIRKPENGQCFPSNIWPAGMITGGEGYHGNHHDRPKDVKIGRKWYEIDFGYLLVWGLQKLGLVKS